MKSILVVDDEEIIRAILVSVLSPDYAVGSASNGREALALFNKQGFDLVITDVLMPEMDGIELVMALLKINPGQKLITISGCDISNGQYDFLHAAQALGGDCIGLRKPIQIDELRAAVAKLLE